MSNILSAGLLFSALMLSSTSSFAGATDACSHLFNTRQPEFVQTKEEQQAAHLRLFDKFEVSSPGGQSAFSVSSETHDIDEYGRIVYRSRQLYLNDQASPEIKEVLSALRREFNIKEYYRAIDLVGRTAVLSPDERGYQIGEVKERVGADFNLNVPHSAMKSDEALKNFLVEQLNFLRNKAAAKERDLTMNAIGRFNGNDAALLKNAYARLGIHTRVQKLEKGVAGEAIGNTIRLSEAELNYPSVIGVAIHEITHTTTNRKLTATASPVAVGRAIEFGQYSHTSHRKLWGPYVKGGYRADEYEARIREAGYFRLKGMTEEAAITERKLQLFYEVEIEDTTRALENFDKVKTYYKDYAGPYGLFSLYFVDMLVSIPIPYDAYNAFVTNTGGDRAAYAKMILEERLRSLKSKSSSQ